MPITLSEITHYLETHSVTNYAALPAAATVPNELWYCINEQGSRWLFNYKSAGWYFSDGINWTHQESVFEASQAEVDAGVLTDKYVSPNTFANSNIAINANNSIQQNGNTLGAIVAIGSNDNFAINFKVNNIVKAKLTSTLFAIANAGGTAFSNISSNASADRNVTIPDGQGTFVLSATTGTATHVPYYTDTTRVTTDSNFKRTANSLLTADGSSNSEVGIRTTNFTSNTGASTSVVATSSTSINIKMIVYSNAFSVSGLILQNMASVASNTTVGLLNSITGGFFKWTIAGIEYLRLTTNGLAINSTANATSTLDVKGSFSTYFKTKSAAYTLTSLDCAIEVDTAGATQTLPTAVGCAGREYEIFNVSNGIVRVDTTSSQTIGNHHTTNPAYIDLLPEEWLTVKSNGVNWRKK